MQCLWLCKRHRPGPDTAQTGDFWSKTILLKLKKNSYILICYFFCFCYFFGFYIFLLFFFIENSLVFQEFFSVLVNQPTVHSGLVSRGRVRGCQCWLWRWLWLWLCRPSKCPEFYTTMITGEKEFTPKRTQFCQNWNCNKLS